ncbi:Protein of unknown function [Desulfonispora thiosulfatigenes DSM 11270]|uniref:DUF3791 domain-containing protein n=1 Tax=Desulfonispora thiosulfatigenes DSM 11270 TaxID=656914 RepID=A0A1W1UHB2_DESTI|nr:DUF3791 domain-containing protein [Desulfonispora thiosulfatigenes]SMB80486.1 Protein of unknown function [Desulfonispora thiosulfatigenes DSM 11270]
MDKNINFIVFCLESYKQAHNLTGKDALKIFNDYKVFDYIKSFYDVLHSTGQDYIVEDIDEYIKSRRNLINV